MGGTTSGRAVGLVDAKGAGGDHPDAMERWFLTFTFAAWRPVGGVVVVEPRRCRLPVSFRSLGTWMERLPPYSIVEVETLRQGRDGATILKRIVEIGFQDAELNGIAAALKRPIVLVHPTLGRLEYARRYGWYEGKVRWSGRNVNVCLSCADPDRPAPTVVVAERLFADQSEWKRRVDEFMTREVLPRWNEQWRPEGESRMTAEVFLSKAVLDSIDVYREGRVDFWHSDGDLLGGHSIVVQADIDRGPTDVSMPG